jgi:hypothetical protein
VNTSIVQISIGYGKPGFYFNNTDGSGKIGEKWAHLDGTPANPVVNQFDGWLACNGVYSRLFKQQDGGELTIPLSRLMAFLNCTGSFATVNLATPRLQLSVQKSS